jgi:flap endonuclease-1
MAARGDVWASNSQDYDSLLFGTPRLVRYITIQGEEWLPSKGRARKLQPEIIELEPLLDALDSRDAIQTE